MSPYLTTVLQQIMASCLDTIKSHQASNNHCMSRHLMTTARQQQFCVTLSVSVPSPPPVAVGKRRETQLITEASGSRTLVLQIVGLIVNAICDSNREFQEPPHKNSMFRVVVQQAVLRL